MTSQRSSRSSSPSESAASSKGTGTAAVSGTVISTDRPEGLIEVLARSIDAVPGVTRREAGIGDFLRTLWKRQPTTEADETHGLSLNQEGSTATLTAAVWVAEDSGVTALSIAQAVATRVNEVITAHGLTPGTHSISVREIERV
ncbi:hypothetical protein [Kocuria sp. HSID16901]|uniref:hypothetical protein n=1 Tax=Kocuria sp. HSID16901 TaxID=2419505 RepID=UPI0006615E75|nr:hypothetical protein [Kocuria sp. HSID16901]RUQ21719.1 hypothetical protein D8M21_05330 [Kocuria sp. HSID16901]